MYASVDKFLPFCFVHAREVTVSQGVGGLQVDISADPHHVFPSGLIGLRMRRVRVLDLIVQLLYDHVVNLVLALLLPLAFAPRYQWNAAPSFPFQSNFVVFHF